MQLLVIVLAPTRPQQLGVAHYCADVTPSLCAAWSLQVGPAAFHVHLKPHTDKAPAQASAGTHAISPAGQGPGLQVFPGSFPDIDCVSTISAGLIACHRQDGPAAAQWMHCTMHLVSAFIHASHGILVQVYMCGRCLSVIKVPTVSAG